MLKVELQGFQNRIYASRLLWVNTTTDAVSASGSGLDPHISLRNAEVQTARVAKARNLGEDKVRALIKQNTDSADLGILGERGVNVLQLNLALDALGKQ